MERKRSSIDGFVVTDGNYLKLKDRGILVRHFDMPKICQYNRITVGLPEQMEIFVDTVREILEENK